MLQYASARMAVGIIKNLRLLYHCAIPKRLKLTSIDKVIGNHSLLPGLCVDVVGEDLRVFWVADGCADSSPEARVHQALQHAASIQVRGGCHAGTIDIALHCCFAM